MFENPLQGAFFGVSLRLTDKQGVGFMFSLRIARSCSFKQKKLLGALVFFGLASSSVCATPSDVRNEISWYVDYQEAKNKSE